MYKPIAAYAAALIERDMAPTIVHDIPSFGVDDAGGYSCVSFHGVRTYSLLGAMRCAWAKFSDDPRPYGSLHKKVEAGADRAYHKKPTDLSRAEAFDVLISIAKS